MDLSDGLADAVHQIAQASGVGIAMDEASLPIREAVRSWHASSEHDAVDAALTGGDDYELVFTVRPAHRRRLRAVAERAGGVALTEIGVVTKEAGLVLRSPHGDRNVPSGFEHFA